MILFANNDIDSKYLSNRMKFTPKVRHEIRKRLRILLTEKLGEFESLIFSDYPVNIETLGSLVGIEFREEELKGDYSAELRLNPSDKFKFLALINTIIDNNHHKRFSKFHETSHVLLELFENNHIAHRTPLSFQDNIYQYKNSTEIICDIAASEMLFYYPAFKKELENISLIKNSVWTFIRELSIKFDASLEATARNFVENYKHKAFFLVITENYRKSELSQVNPDQMKLPWSVECSPKPKPRIAYAVSNRFIDFDIPKNKSFSDDSFIYDSFYNGNVLQNEVNIELFDWSKAKGEFLIGTLPQNQRALCIGIEI